MFYNAITDNPYFILLIIILVFGLIALIVFLIRKFVPGIKEKEEKVSEEVAVQEELERILENVEDEEAKKQMEQVSQKREEHKSDQDVK